MAHVILEHYLKAEMAMGLRRSYSESVNNGFIHVYFTVGTI